MHLSLDQKGFLKQPRFGIYLSPNRNMSGTLTLGGTNSLRYIEPITWSHIISSSHKKYLRNTWAVPFEGYHIHEEGIKLSKIMGLNGNYTALIDTGTYLEYIIL